MKKLSTMLLFLLLGVFLVAGSAWATYFTYSENQLLAMQEVWDNPDGAATLVDYGTYGSGPEFVVKFTSWDASGFAQIGIGDWDYSNRMDLSSYEGIKLTFSNSTYATTGDMWVNMFIQTYDPDASTWNNYYENTWTLLQENEERTLTLDFSSSHYWAGDSYNGIVSVANLDNVYKWGFQVGNNIDDGTANLIHGTVNPVPEPATMLLLGVGLCGLAFVGRKKLIRHG